MRLAHHLRRWALHRSTLVLVVSFAAFTISGAASAFPIGQVCTGGGQFCNNVASFLAPGSGAGGTLQARFRGGPFICSNFRIHYLVNGVEVAVTGFVNNSQSTGFVNLGFITPGTRVDMQAEGEISGCNVGTLISWGGKLKLKQGP